LIPKSSGIFKPQIDDSPNGRLYNSTATHQFILFKISILHLLLMFIQVIDPAFDFLAATLKDFATLPDYILYQALP
jgi:hypothetical protein